MRYPYEETIYEIPVPGFQPGDRFRMTLLADLHNCAFDEVLRRLDEARPELVLCAGDMINCPRFPRKPAWDNALSFYRELAKRFPVYAVRGNHEERWKDAKDESLRAGYEAFCGELSEMKIELLDNRIVKIKACGTVLNLAGLSPDRHLYRGVAKGMRMLPKGTAESLLGEKPEGFTVAVSHTPNTIEDLAAWGADLVCSGHIHGGIMRPGHKTGLIGPGLQLLPPYTKGRYQSGRTTLLLSAGLGEHSLPVRIGNPRQIIYADLTEAPHGL
ncbi:MAG: metallophosphoesterase [Lachnospiraceae bacterium]|nr:metallophosphoesterase [Lachnospiraceae bacterium]